MLPLHHLKATEYHNTFESLFSKVHVISEKQFSFFVTEQAPYNMTSHASGSEITPCNKIDKPPVVYRFTGNTMTSITTLRA